MKVLVIVLVLCHLNYAEEESANLEQVFEDMDTNGNNKVTKKEVRLYFNNKPLSLYRRYLKANLSMTEYVKK